VAQFPQAGLWIRNSVPAAFVTCDEKILAAAKRPKIETASNVRARERRKAFTLDFRHEKLIRIRS
jgi:hypothetical protein